MAIAMVCLVVQELITQVAHRHAEKEICSDLPAAEDDPPQREVDNRHRCAHPETHEELIHPLGIVVMRQVQRVDRPIASPAIIRVEGESVHQIFAKAPAQQTKNDEEQPTGHRTVFAAGSHHQQAGC